MCRGRYRKLAVSEKRAAGDVVRFGELLDRTLARMTQFSTVTFAGKTETVKVKSQQQNMPPPIARHGASLGMAAYRGA